MTKLTKGKTFPVITLSWADIDLDEFSDKGITDDTLKRMARMIGDGMMESGAWNDALEAACDSYLKRA